MGVHVGILYGCPVFFAPQKVAGRPYTTPIWVLPGCDSGTHMLLYMLSYIDNGCCFKKVKSCSSAYC